MPEPHPRSTRFRRSRVPGVLGTNCGDLFRRTELRARVHRGLDHVETVLGAERLADRVTDAEKQGPAPKAKVRRGAKPPRFNDGRLPYPPTNGRRVAVSIRGATPTPRDPPRPPDQPTHRPTNLAPRSTTTFRGVSRSPISAVVDDDVPRSVAVGFCSAAKCRDAWFRAPRFRMVFIPVAPRSAAPPHPRFAWARTVYPRFA